MSSSQAAALRLTRHAAAGRRRPPAAPRSAARAEVVLPARTILVAAGTQPNTVLGARRPGACACSTAAISGRSTRRASRPSPERVAKPAEVRVLMSLRDDGRAVSFFGDLHPSFAGNVVKAMGGAKQGYPVVSRVLARRPAAEPAAGGDARRGSTTSCARACTRSMRLTPNIVEVVVRAPMAARAFQPGQFYRLQNYETRRAAHRRHDAGDGRPGADRRLGRPRRGAAVDDRARDGRLVRSLRAVAAGRAGGPDGPDRHADRDARRRDRGAGRRRARQRRAVLDRRGVAGARARECSISPATRRIEDRYKVEEIERAADCVVWCCDEAPGFAPGRPQDAPLSATSSRRSRPTARARSARPPIPLGAVDRIIAIGSDGMMAAVGEARRAVLEALSQPGPSRHRLDQLADAMHDEGDLRPVPAAPPRSGDRQGERGVLLLQPGPGARPGRFPHPAPPPVAERRAGKADQAVDRPLPATLRLASGRRRGVAPRRALRAGVSAVAIARRGATGFDEIASLRSQ